MCVYMCTTLVPSGCGGQNRALDLLELELQMTVAILWVLGSERGHLQEPWCS